MKEKLTNVITTYGVDNIDALLVNDETYGKIAKELFYFSSDYMKSRLYYMDISIERDDSVPTGDVYIRDKN